MSVQLSPEPLAVEGHACLVPPPRRLGQRHGGDGGPVGDAGQVLLLGRVVAGDQQQVGGQGHAREVGGAQQGPTHLLEHHDQLHVRVAGAAELLGDGQALQAQLFGHLRPDRRVVALGGLHQPAYLGLGGLVLQEAADRPAQLFLLFAEGKIHAGLSPLGSRIIGGELLSSP